MMRLAMALPGGGTSPDPPHRASPDGDGGGRRVRTSGRVWSDPATVIAAIFGLAGMAMAISDGVDSLPISFGYWPYLLVAYAAYWFLGVRVSRWIAPPGDDGGAHDR